MLRYAPPELVMGMGHTFSLDWWTLGVMTYEILSNGETPFKGSEEEMLEAIPKGQITFPEEYFNETSKGPYGFAA